MDSNVKKITNRQIYRGLEKMKEWEEPSEHIISTFKRSMRFLAQDVYDEVSGNVDPGNSLEEGD